MNLKYYIPLNTCSMHFPFCGGKGIVFENITDSPLSRRSSSITATIIVPRYMLKFNEEFYYGLNKRSYFIAINSEFLENY